MLQKYLVGHYLISCPFLIFDLSALTCILKYINILTYGQSFKDTILKTKQR